MKKVTVLSVLIMFLSASISYAQYGDYYDGTNSYSYDNMPKSKSKSKNRRRKKRQRREENKLKREEKDGKSNS